MVKFLIDGNECEADEDTLILEAARKLDISVPTFCYQERLTPLASCRMCLVEVEGRPKLEPACATHVAEGMVVRTDNALVAETRKSMLELLLANHPLDCPICDKAGECELQETVFEYGADESRFRDEKRVFREDDLLLNSMIIFNAQRCIQCQRCVRMCEEVVGAVALGTIERGMDSEVTGFANSLVGCDHCGNCIEVCPVGALMSNPYRYKARPWDLVETDTTCFYCGTGCQLSVGVRDGHLARVRSKYETGVNGETLCVKGRFGFDAIDGSDRLRHPMIRKAGALTQAGWQEALDFISNRIREIEKKGLEIGGIVSPRLTNETIYLFQKMMRTVFHSNNIDSSTRLGSSLLNERGLDKALMNVITDFHKRRPLPELLVAQCVLIIGTNITDDNPVTDYLARTAFAGRESELFIASARPSRLDAEAAASVRLLPGHEGHLLSDLLALMSAENKATSRNPDVPYFLSRIRPTLEAAQSMSFLVGMDLLRSPNAVSSLGWLNRLASSLQDRGKDVSVQLLFDRPNQLGAWDLGALPGVLPGWLSSNDADARNHFENVWRTKLPETSGRDIHEMLSGCEGGEIGALYVLGGDPVATCPDRDRVVRALSKPDLLIVQDACNTQTAQIADVVLPAANFVEESGTFTNNEGRLQRQRAIRMPSFEARANVEILGLVAEALNRMLVPASPSDIFAEITGVVPSYATLRFAESSNDGSFTARFEGESNDADAALPLPVLPVLADPSRLILVTGDCRFHSGSLSWQSINLSTLEAEPYAEMCPDDAVRLGIEDGNLVILKSGSGKVKAFARVNRNFPRGVVYVPENFPKLNLNRLFKSAEYPVSIEIHKARDALSVGTLEKA